MSTEESVWFRVGYALERARHPVPAAGKRLSGLAERAGGKAAKRVRAEVEEFSSDDLVTAGLALAAGKLLDVWRPRRKAGIVRLLRAAAAGAGAALLVDLVRPLLAGTPRVAALDEGTGERMLAGAGQGLLYGAVVEPRLPGPSVVKGALFASAEYAADPAGGLSELVGAHEPRARLPVIGGLLSDLEAHERSYLEHLTFGIALALLYGSSPSSNGIPVDEEEDG